MTAVRPSASFCRKVLTEAPGIFQATDRRTGNLGFGGLYWAFARALRPRHALVIGSGRGFAPIIMAKALRDNGRGRLSFVDPSFSFGRETWLPTNRGEWDDPQNARRKFSGFQVQFLATHYKERDDEFFGKFHARRLPPIDLALIDGDHRHGAVAYDFRETVRRMPRGGHVLLHDALHPLGRFGSGVGRFVSELRAAGWNVVVLPGGAGLAIVEVPPRGRRSS